MAFTAVEAEVWYTVQALNRAWTAERDPEALRQWFHPHRVVFDPVHCEHQEGRETRVAGWKSFVEKTKIHYWHELEPRVQVCGQGNFAVVTYYDYDMSYEMDGKTIKTGGQDMCVLVKENGRWWAVADQFPPHPGESSN